MLQRLAVQFVARRAFQQQSFCAVQNVLFLSNHRIHENANFKPIINIPIQQQRKISTSCFRLAAEQPFTIKTVQERIMLVLSLYDKIDPKKLTLDSNFFTDLGLDSLDHVEIIMELENEFNFEIPDGDADRMKTPRDIFQYICDKNDVYH